MQHIYIILRVCLCGWLLSLLPSCYGHEDIVKTKNVTPLTVQLTAEFEEIKPSTLADLTVTLENFQQGVKITLPLSSTKLTIPDILPGIYSINIVGKTTNDEGKPFYVNGSKVNHPIIPGEENIVINVNGKPISPIVFKEIYYAGSPERYFRDQFYEIYNNSDEVIYLDGIHFANLVPSKATTVLPVWPAEDNGKYVYGERLWKFPGSGKEYPLQPGESCVISQFAANHKLETYNPNSPVDCTSSDFEFNLNNPKFPDMPAYDMIHVFNDGKKEPGRVPQYLTSVFGGAYVIFRVPEGEEYDPVNNKNLQAQNLAVPRKVWYAKIPISYVLDAVEAGDNENMITAKRVPGILDAGMTYVGATYNGLSVARKKMAERPDGTPILQDTNNSTEDFDRGLVPELRRYKAKTAPWNHLLKK
ncbi:DUF4876 domain-containing protein [Porphyromonas sp.]|uniref:DUF4876 domain-containing protein n=1 Tax=Porphyromonas sp. TaxID=1924944 RepID=UPI0026DC7064|nr:DUF4876 domain-containing protein [Porphyromonas sp.]MDO4771176.1 DUF4876 domain-containing protein [Porphyromonas sp.]